MEELCFKAMLKSDVEERYRGAILRKDVEERMWRSDVEKRCGGAMLGSDVEKYRIPWGVPGGEDIQDPIQELGARS